MGATIRFTGYNPTADWAKLLSGMGGMAGIGFGMDPSGSVIRNLLGTPDPDASPFAKWDKIAREASGDGENAVWRVNSFGEPVRSDWRGGPLGGPVPFDITKPAITGNQAAAIARRKAAAFGQPESGSRSVPYRPMSLGEFWDS